MAVQPANSNKLPICDHHHAHTIAER